MEQWRKRPVVIKAALISDLIRDGNLPSGVTATRVLPAGTFQISIPTLEGTMIGFETDYLIEGVKGELYPCKPDIFLETYEKVDTPVDVL